MIATITTANSLCRYVTILTKGNLCNKTFRPCFVSDIGISVISCIRELLRVTAYIYLADTAITCLYLNVDSISPIPNVSKWALDTTVSVYTNFAKSNTILSARVVGNDTASVAKTISRAARNKWVISIIGIPFISSQITPLPRPP